MSGSSDRRNAALAYAQLGFAVLPLYTVRKGVCQCSKGAACKSPGKHPIMNGGVHAASKDRAEVLRMWKQNPGANIGIATGEVSGVLAIDVDPRNGGGKTFDDLMSELGALPRTCVANTGGGGTHRLFVCPTGGFPTSHKLAGVDVQGDNAFIVASPSRHLSGKRYRWENDVGPSQCKPAELPVAWLDRLRGLARPVPASSATKLGNLITEGRRNSTLTSLAGSMQRAGMSAEAIKAGLCAENSARCLPPLDEAEVERIVASVGRYPAAATSGDEAEVVMRTVLDGDFAGGQHLMRCSDGRFWHYDGMRWTTIDQPTLAGTILRAIEAIPGRRGQSTASLLRQVTALLEAKVAAEGDALRFTTPPLQVVNTRTGELWIGKDGKPILKAHNPKSYLRECFYVGYDPAATCPRYEQAVKEIFGKAPDPQAMADFWHELMGYAMQAERPVPVVILGWGSGNNGKTKLVETFVRLVGPELVHAMPIGDIEKSRFTAASLLGKLAIIDDDVRAGTRLPDGDLKRHSEEKTITGERKYGPSFSFTARTLIMMLFNNPPSIADLSHGLQRRLYVVPFDRTFSPKRTEPNLFKSIWRDELPGILNCYLAGLRRVIQRGWTFQPPEHVERAKVALIDAANPVPTFIKECCKPQGSCLVLHLYDAYTQWASSSGVKRLQQRAAFGRTLENLGYIQKRSNRGAKVIGLSLKSNSGRYGPRCHKVIIIVR